MRIEQELASNADELRRAIATNKASLAANQQVVASLVDLLKTANPDQASLRSLLGRLFGHGAKLELPTWRRAAWDATIADRSATYLVPADLRRYAEIYAAGQDLQQAEQVIYSGPLYDQVATLQIALMLGHADARQAALLVMRLALIEQELLGSQQSMLDTLSRAAGTPR